MLLQGDGGIYSCVRGQGVNPFYYGNIFNDSISQIMQTASQKISVVHKKYGFHEDCQRCHYLHHCKTGCAFVKNETRVGKSYTCALQKQIYEDYPEKYPVLASEMAQKKYVHGYILNMHPNLLSKVSTVKGHPEVILSSDLYEEKNALREIIANDPILISLYSEDGFLIEIDGVREALESPLLKTQRKIYSLCSDQCVVLYIKKSLFDVNCKDLVRNNLMLQMLRDTFVVYGDEQRKKQEHTFNYQRFFNQLNECDLNGDAYMLYDLMGLLRLNSESFLAGVINNLFVTTQYLREYHYVKQKENAFYHIQAINLPFQNFEFYWL